MGNGIGDLMRELVVWYAEDPVKCEDFCLKMGGRSLLNAVIAAAEQAA